MGLLSLFKKLITKNEPDALDAPAPISDAPALPAVADPIPAMLASRVAEEVVADAAPARVKRTKKIKTPQADKPVPLSVQFKQQAATRKYKLRAAGDPYFKITGKCASLSIVTALENFQTRDKHFFFFLEGNTFLMVPTTDDDGMRPTYEKTSNIHQLIFSFNDKIRRALRGYQLPVVIKNPKLEPHKLGGSVFKMELTKRTSATPVKKKVPDAQLTLPIADDPPAVVSTPTPTLSPTLSNVVIGTVVNKKHNSFTRRSFFSGQAGHASNKDEQFKFCLTSWSITRNMYDKYFADSLGRFFIMVDYVKQSLTIIPIITGNYHWVLRHARSNFYHAIYDLYIYRLINDGKFPFMAKFILGDDNILRVNLPSGVLRPASNNSVPVTALTTIAVPAPVPIQSSPVSAPSVAPVATDTPAVPEPVVITPPVVKVPIPETVVKKPRRKRDIQEDPLFAEFWEIYPRKDARKRALKIWMKLSNRADLLILIKNTLRWQIHLSQWVKDNGDHIPMASTYLDGERWKDEPKHYMKGWRSIDPLSGESTPAADPLTLYPTNKKE